jgi:hypothetical protein
MKKNKIKKKPGPYLVCQVSERFNSLKTEVTVKVMLTTDSQSASLSRCQALIRGPRPDFCYCQRVAGLSTWGALCDERTGLSFTIAAGPRQLSHSRVRVPRHSRPYFALSDSRIPQPGGSGPRIYVPQEQGGPLLPPGTKCLLNIQLHGAEPFLRSRKFCSYSRTSQHFIELEGSLPCSQEPSSGLYPGPD